MVAITQETAARVSGRCSPDDVTTRKVLFGLRRALAREAVTDELYEDLEAVLGEGAQPSSDEVPAIAERLRATTTRLVENVPYLVTPYPVADMQRLIDLSAQQPPPDQARVHLVRFALAILALLDLMGDAAA